MLPGTHTLGPIEHRDEPGPLNLIRRGQGIFGRFDTDRGVMMPLAPGEMSLHHTYVVHRSGPNDTNDRRIGLGISYIPTSVKQGAGGGMCALLVRGQDRYGHFRPEARLVRQGSPESVAGHAAAVAAFKAHQDSGAAKISA